MCFNSAKYCEKSENIFNIIYCIHSQKYIFMPTHKEIYVAIDVLKEPIKNK